MENKPMNHLCTLRKTAVENVVPYITRCFLYDDSWEQFLSGFRVKQLVCVYLRDNVNSVAAKLSFFGRWPWSCGLCL